MIHAMVGLFGSFLLSQITSLKKPTRKRSRERSPKHQRSKPPWNLQCIQLSQNAAHRLWSWKGCKKNRWVGFSLWNQRPCIFHLGRGGWSEKRISTVFPWFFSNIIFVFIISEPFGTSAQSTHSCNRHRLIIHQRILFHEVFSSMAFKSGIIFEDQAKVKILRPQIGHQSQSLLGWGVSPWNPWKLLECPMGGICKFRLREATWKTCHLIYSGFWL